MPKGTSGSGSSRRTGHRHVGTTTAPPDCAGRVLAARRSRRARTAAGAGDFAGGAKTAASEINDPYTGKRLHKLPGQQPLAWVGNKRLIAFDIAPGTNEFHNRLVLVTIGSERPFPLSGFRKGNDGDAGRWEPRLRRALIFKKVW